MHNVSKNYFQPLFLFTPNGKQSYDSQIWNLKSAWWNLSVTGCNIQHHVQTKTFSQRAQKSLSGRTVQRNTWMGRMKTKREFILVYCVFCIHCCKKYLFTPPTIWFRNVWHYTCGISRRLAVEFTGEGQAGNEVIQREKEWFILCWRAMAVKLAWLLS